MFEWNTVGSTVFEIPSYIFFALIGIILSLSLYPFLLYFVHEPLRKFFPKLLLCGLFLLFGAKAAGITVNLLNTIQKGMPVTHETFLESGIVFYGGVSGLIISFYIICLIKDNHPPAGAFDALAVIIPLFHAVARIGCFFAGCCYGIECRSAISVYYITQKNGIINSTLRIPVQLIESAFNLLLFMLLLVLFMKRIHKGKLIFIYLFLYASVRFVLEFFRGDDVRGIYGWFSSSQIISVIIIIFLFVKYFKGRKKER